jgi:hypothetical protein
MKDISEEARKLWQKFIHQPQTARYLVFHLLLAGSYEKAIEKLSSILTLGVS